MTRQKNKNTNTNKNKTKSWQKKGWALFTWKPLI